MPSKVKTARLCVLINGWINLVGAILFAFMFLLASLGIGLSSEEGSGAAALFFGFFGLVIALIFAVYAVVSFLCAKGIRERKGWARIMGIIIGILSLPNFPGIVLGIFILIGLFDQEATAWFEPQK